jgi:hypothetical protein
MVGCWDAAAKGASVEADSPSTTLSPEDCATDADVVGIASDRIMYKRWLDRASLLYVVIGVLRFCACLIRGLEQSWGQHYTTHTTHLGAQITHFINNLHQSLDTLA